MGYKKRLGGWGETIAAEYLAGNGYVILERNFRTQYGEIDIIAQDKEILVFVEVKTRTSRKYGYPEEAISPKKEAPVGISTSVSTNSPGNGKGLADRCACHRAD